MKAVVAKQKNHWDKPKQLPPKSHVAEDGSNCSRDSRLASSKKDQAKRRKVDGMLTMQANSNIGSDQGDVNWGIKVAVMNEGPSKVEFSNMGMQSSINQGVGVAAKVAQALGSTTNKREAQSIGNLIQAGKAKMIRTTS